MTNAAQRAQATDTQHVDVLIAGAGISGVGSAYHLQQQCPGKSYLILEMQESFGGTWKTHKYPGVRSDSDLYTFGYRFKPWIGAPIASAEEILKYMGEVIEHDFTIKNTGSSDLLVLAVKPACGCTTPGTCSARTWSKSRFAIRIRPCEFSFPVMSGVTMPRSTMTPHPLPLAMCSFAKVPMAIATIPRVI